MKSFLHIFLMLAMMPLVTSCSSLSKEECTAMNWHHQGQRDVRKGKNWRHQFQDYKKTCGEHQVSVSAKDYLAGVKYEGVIQCTNQRNFHDKGGWAIVGARDALKGHKLSHYNSYNKKCEPYRVKPQGRLFKKGYMKGLAAFCTYKEGRRFGQDGGNYLNTCSKKTERRFLKGYMVGTKYYHAHELGRRAQMAAAAEEDLEEKMKDQRDRVLDLQSQLNRHRLGDSIDVTRLESQIRSKESEVLSAQHSSDDLPAKVRLETELANLRAQLSAAESREQSHELDLVQRLATAENSLEDLRVELDEAEEQSEIWQTKAQKARREAREFEKANSKN